MADSAEGCHVHIKITRDKHRLALRLRQDRFPGKQSHGLLMSEQLQRVTLLREARQSRAEPGVG